jgi:hypothetical protein
LPPFDRPWIDCIQEEAQIESKNGKQRGIDDENLALVSHARKGKRNGSPQREASPEKRKKNQQLCSSTIDKYFLEIYIYIYIYIYILII